MLYRFAERPTTHRTTKALPPTTPDFIPTATQALYPSCNAHSDCKENQFCGTKCWTDGCGEDSDVSKGSTGPFCQPCGKCQTDQRSATGSCDVCSYAGSVCLLSSSALRQNLVVHGVIFCCLFLFLFLFLALVVALHLHVLRYSSVPNIQICRHGKIVFVVAIYAL